MNNRTVICSIGNSQIKNIVSLLKYSKAREKQRLFVIEGLKIFEEARLHGGLVKALFSEAFYRAKIIEDSNFFYGLDYEVVKDTIFQGISETKTPQGVLGLVRMPEYSLEELLTGPMPCLLLLEDIRDPGNLGTIIRTAEGAGVSGIVMNSSCVDVYNPKVIRSTMGSVFRVPFYRTDNFIDSIMRLKKNDIEILAAHLSGVLYDAEEGFLKSCAILIGNEANGLSKEASAIADRLIRIPMAGKVESLNAAVAAAILMYEAFRQRKNKNGGDIVGN